MSKRAIFTFLALCVLNVSRAQSVKDLQFLIGDWELKEVVYEGTDKEYTELGKRSCKYELNDTYISCTTTASRHGKERTYISKINFDKSTKLFTMTTQFSDYDFRGNYKMILYPDLNQLSIMPGFSIEDEGHYRSIIDFSNAEILVWSGYQSGFKGVPVWKKFYTEIATKVK